MDVIDSVFPTEEGVYASKRSASDEFVDDGTVEALYRSGKPISDSELKKRHAYEAKLKMEKQKEVRSLEEHKDLENRENNRVIHLPMWPESVRGVPNSVLRGSLFAAIQGRYAKHVENLILHDKDNLRITYRGKRLTQSDLDVWEYALHLARNQNLGYRVYFTESNFLKGIGRATGKTQYKWLHNCLSRMGATTVEVKHNKKIYMGSLIDEAYKDEEAGKYCVVINPKIARLFDAGYTLINWEERKILGKKPLAQWLHGYISSHEKWFPHKVETIRMYSGSETKELKKFRQQLKAALETLLVSKMIKSYKIDNHDLIYVEL